MRGSDFGHGTSDVSDDHRRSVSQLLARMLRETVERETGYDTAKERSLALLREGMDLGTSGRISWSRDDLHER
jgi:hypothetical protein